MGRNEKSVSDVASAGDAGFEGDLTELRHHADATETTLNICACEGILVSLRARNKTQVKMKAKEGYLTDTGQLYLRT